MIEQLEVENLKSLGGRQTVELAPITLVYGPNSAGKSSLLQSLALLKQTLEPRAASLDTERQPLNLRGALVDLGSFGAAVHRHELDRVLSFGARFTPAPARSGVRPPLRRGRSGYVRLSFGFNPQRHTVNQVDVTVGSGGDNVRYVPETRGEQFAGVDSYFRVATKADGGRLGAMAASSARDPRVNESVGEFLTHTPRPTFGGRGFFPIYPMLREWQELQRSAERVPAHAVGLIGSMLSDVVYGPALAFVEVLSEMAYLGPLRAAPTRFQARSGEVYNSVGARGEHTPLLLMQQPGLLGPVNQWLTQLGIHYELDVAPVESDLIGLEIGDLVVTRLVDTRSRIAVTPQDVGFGISQLLPVVVQVLAGKGRTICVEQPEIHIHPRLQAEVADLFIEAARQRGNQVIVETHSENLMLRLQRRIREARADDWLTPDKVCVLYIDHDEQGLAAPRRLRLDERGNFIDPWPHGFFAERLDELFSTDGSSSRKVMRRKLQNDDS